MKTLEPDNIAEILHADDDSVANTIHLKYHRNQKMSAKIFVIEGESGTGKSLLARAFAPYPVCAMVDDVTGLADQIISTMETDSGVVFDNVRHVPSWKILLAARPMHQIVITARTLDIPPEVEPYVARIRLVKPLPRVSE